MKTLKIGIAGFEDYKARTFAIARGEYVPPADAPKVWFTSLESLAKVLSERNRALLALIARTQPAALTELAEKSARAESNLSRTLKTMEQYGLLHFEKGHGRNLAPRVDYTDVILDLPLQGP
jgi:predicted transcriptional regulator